MTTRGSGGVARAAGASKTKAAALSRRMADALDNQPDGADDGSDGGLFHAVTSEDALAAYDRCVALAADLMRFKVQERGLGAAEAGDGSARAEAGLRMFRSMYGRAENDGERCKAFLDALQEHWPFANAVRLRLQTDPGTTATAAVAGARAELGRVPPLRFNAALVPAESRARAAGAFLDTDWFLAYAQDIAGVYYVDAAARTEYHAQLLGQYVRVLAALAGKQDLEHAGAAARALRDAADAALAPPPSPKKPLGKAAAGAGKATNKAAKKPAGPKRELPADVAADAHLAGLATTMRTCVEKFGLAEMLPAEASAILNTRTIRKLTGKLVDTAAEIKPDAVNPEAMKEMLGGVVGYALDGVIEDNDGDDAAADGEGAGEGDAAGGVQATLESMLDRSLDAVKPVLAQVAAGGGAAAAAPASEQQEAATAAVEPAVVITNPFAA